MLLDEFVKSIDLHDSNLIELYHEKNDLIMRIDLCMWRQVQYVEGEEEMKEVLLKFYNIKQYLWDSAKKESDIDYETILEISCDGNLLKMVLLDESVSILTFECACVDVIY